MFCSRLLSFGRRRASWNAHRRALLYLLSPSLHQRTLGENGDGEAGRGKKPPPPTKSIISGGSEVEDGDVEKVAKAFRLVQVVYVVMVAGRGGQSKERREHWG